MRSIDSARGKMLCYFGKESWKNCNVFCKDAWICAEQLSSQTVEQGCPGQGGFSVCQQEKDGINLVNGSSSGLLLWTFLRG
jgi:hypothetical protein